MCQRSPSRTRHSYGAFEITVGIDPLVPEPLELLDDVANAGYAEIDLGPLGYLGSPGELTGRRCRGHAGTEADDR